MHGDTIPHIVALPPWEKYGRFGDVDMITQRQRLKRGQSGQFPIMQSRLGKSKLHDFHIHASTSSTIKTVYFYRSAFKSNFQKF